MYLISSIAALAWFALVAALAYDFKDPAASSLVHANLSFLVPMITQVPRNAWSIIPVAIFLLAALGPGSLLLRCLTVRREGLAEWLVFSMGLGLAVQTFVTLAIGQARLLQPSVMYLVVAASFGLTVYEAMRFSRSAVTPVYQAREKWPLTKQLLVIALTLGIIANIYLALLGALMPEVQFDARWYHLAEAKRYAQHHAFFNGVQSLGMASLGLPHYQEVLYAAMTVLSGVAAAKVLSWTNIVLAALFIIVFCRRFCGSATIGLFAALLFVGSPLIDWSASTAGNDLTLAPFTILSLYAFFRWKADRRAWQWIALAGALCGFTLGVKPFAIFNVIVLVVLILLVEYLDRVKGRHNNDVPRSPWLSIAAFCGAAVIFVLPSLITAWTTTGNPVFPFANSIFHSPYWTPAMAAEVAQSYSGRGAVTSINALFTFPWTALWHSDQYHDLPGPLFLFGLPILLVAAYLKRKSNAVLPIAVFYLFSWTILWFASGAIEIRYTEAIWPFTLIAFANSFTLDSLNTAPQKILQTVLALIVAAIVILNCQLLIPWQRHAQLEYVEGKEVVNWQYLYDDVPERNIQLQYVPMIEYVNAHLDARHDKVYDAADGILFNLYSDIDLFNGSQYDGPAHSGQWTLASGDAYQRLKANGITHVMVFDSSLKALKDAPLWKHLSIGHHAAPSSLYGGNPAYGETLLEVK